MTPFNTTHNYYAAETSPWGTKPTHFIRENIDRLTKPSALDLGGGDGKNALFLAQQGFFVHVVDPSEEARERCLTQADEVGVSGNISFTCADIRTFIPTQKYSTILCTWVLHYLSPEEGRNVIEHMQKWTEQGGTNILIAYTTNGALTDPEHCYLEEEEALERYRAWNILHYKKQLGGSKLNLPQERVMILAQNKG